MGTARRNIQIADTRAVSDFRVAARQRSVNTKQHWYLCRGGRLQGSVDPAGSQIPVLFTILAVHPEHPKQHWYLLPGRPHEAARMSDTYAVSYSRGVARQGPGHTDSTGICDFVAA